MSVLALRVQGAIDDNGTTVATRLIDALAANKPDLTLDLVTPDFSMFGVAMAGKVLAAASKQFAAFGKLVVKDVKAAPDGVFDAIPESDRDYVFAGPIVDDDQMLIATCETGGTEMSLALLIDGSSPSRPKVRRIFDPIAFAEAVLPA